MSSERRRPRVPYQETLRGRAEHVEGTLAKEPSGRGPFAVCSLRVEPGPRGSGVEFLDETLAGAIPRDFIAAIERGVREACERGILAGHPLTDIRVRCVGGEFDAARSSEQAFRTAGELALRATLQQAQPVLLEPLVKLDVHVPDEFVGEVLGDLSARRGRVAGVEQSGALQTVSAEVPQAELLGYASDLAAFTDGQGRFALEFSHYEEVPKEIEDRIVAEAGAPRAAE